VGLTGSSDGEEMVKDLLREDKNDSNPSERCGKSVVIPQQAAELFSTGDETVTFLTGSGDRHEDHMASALVQLVRIE
jgi:hypothetical protein